MDTDGILVVESSDAEAKVVEAALAEAGYRLAGRADSARQGLEMARSLVPAAVLVSVTKDNGGEVAAFAHGISEEAGIPVIVMSGLAQDRLPVDTGPDGPYGYLPTPVDGPGLRLAVEVTRCKHRMMRKLVQARQAAEAADRAKTSFLATVSHELRTPMNGVLGMTELLLLSDLGEPYRENVVLIKDSALSLLSVLNQIIDYSKLETSSSKLRELDFRFEDLLTGVLSQYRRPASSKGVRIEYAVDPAVPGWLRGDSAKIRQVLGNLVNNAVKFTPSGLVMVDVSPAPDGGRRGEDGVFDVQVLVQDSGVGIEPGNMESIFESFSQVEDHLCHSSGGLGLGLAIVNRLLVILGGTIRCDSRPGKGSTFSFVIPLGRSRYEANSPLAETMEGGKPLQGARVLVAEDDLVNQRYITRLLEKMGCAVTLARDGRQAVDALRDATFDIVLMDVEMPVLDGIEATRSIRRPETGCLDPDIPIVALTAHAMWGDEQRCMHAGMTDYVAKPVDMETVASIIQSTLDAR
jgi:signal transduction histidine kinase/ActR/RegA family two-component response regulator